MALAWPGTCPPGEACRPPASETAWRGRGGLRIYMFVHPCPEPDAEMEAAFPTFPGVPVSPALGTSNAGKEARAGTQGPRVCPLPAVFPVMAHCSLGCALVTVSTCQVLWELCLQFQAVLSPFLGEEREWCRAERSRWEPVARETPDHTPRCVEGGSLPLGIGVTWDGSPSLLGGKRFPFSSPFLQLGPPLAKLNRNY